MCTCVHYATICAALKVVIPAIALEEPFKEGTVSDDSQSELESSSDASSNSSSSSSNSTSRSSSETTSTGDDLNLDDSGFLMDSTFVFDATPQCEKLFPGSSLTAVGALAILFSWFASNLGLARQLLGTFSTSCTNSSSQLAIFYQLAILKH